VDTAFMGLTSYRWMTITETVHTGGVSAQRESCRCHVADERAADRHALICDGPCNNAEPEPTTVSVVTR
jgi:hypothetical protein